MKIWIDDAQRNLNLDARSNANGNILLTKDSSLKKNSAMVTKLKTPTSFSNAAALEKLLAELKSLNFSKFITEFATASCEGVLKCRNSSDFQAFNRICSVLHQNSAEFSPLFLTHLLKTILPPLSVAASGEPKNLSELRSSLRMISEMVLNGLIDTNLLIGRNSIVPNYNSISQLKVGNENATFKDLLALDGGIVFVILFFYLKTDSKLENSHLLISFCKFYAPFYVQSEGDSGKYISMTIQKYITELIDEYYDKVCENLKREHEELARLKNYSEERQITHGALTEKKKLELEATTKNYENVNKIASALSESLAKPLPDMNKNDDESKKDQFSAVIVDFQAKNIQAIEQDWYKTPWEDYETMTFYTNIPDLINYANPVALMVKKKKKKKKERKSEEDDLDETFYEDVDDDILEFMEKRVEKEEKEDDDTILPTSSSISATLDVILSSLPNLINRTLLDQAVVDFCNVCGTCRDEALSKLISTFVSVPRFRSDILPYYARFIATTQKYIPEIGNTVIACLYSEFKKRYRKQDQFNLEHRMKNVKFLGELVKFGVCPTHIIFYCMKRLILPESSGNVFNSNHIIVACSLLESCGRFMSKIPDIAKKWDPIIDVLEKKCKTINLEAHVLITVENALLSARPLPPIALIKYEKLRTPLEHFIRKLIYTDLNFKNIEKTVLFLRKLPWNAPIKMKLWDPKLELKDQESTPYEIPKVDKENHNKDEIELHVPSILKKIFTKIWKVRFNQVQCMAGVLAGLKKYHFDFCNYVADEVLEQIRIGMEDYTHFQYHQRRVSTIRYLGELYHHRIVNTEAIFHTLYSLVIFGHGTLPSKENPSSIDPPDDFFRIRLITELLEVCGKSLLTANQGTLLDNFLVYFQYYVFTKDAEDISVDIKFVIDEVFQKLRPKMDRIQSYEQASEKVKQLQKTMFGKEFGHVIVKDESLSNDTLEMVPKIENIEISHEPTAEEEEMFTKEFHDILNESVAARKNEKRGQLELSIPVNLQQTSPVVEGEEELDVISDRVKFKVLTKGKTSSASISVPKTSRLAISALSYQEEIKREQSQIKHRVLAIQKRSTSD